MDLNGVRQIDLGANKLSGTLPPEIGELTNLQYLYISNYGTQVEDGAQLTGSIPPEIGKLQKLELSLFMEQRILVVTQKQQV